LRLDPDDEEIYGTLGLVRYLLGEYGVAEKFFEQALSINENYATAWMWRGLAMEKQGQLQQATDYYRRAASLEPLSVAVIVNLAQALQSAGNQEEAMKKMLAISNPGLSSAHYNRTLSDLSLRQGDMIAAYRSVVRAQNIDPEDEYSTAQLALVLQDLGQGDARQELFGISLESGLPGYGARKAMKQIYIRMDRAKRTLQNS